MNKKKILEDLKRDSFNGQITIEDFEARVQKYAELYDKERQKGQTLPLDSVSVSPLSGEVIDKAAKEWSENRSIGDSGQDRNCYYDFRKGMEAMWKLIQDSR